MSDEAPRWQLAQPHYLKVPGTEWEYKENSRTKGKAKTMKLEVPLYIDPNDPGDWNHFPTGNKEEGVTVVTNSPNGVATDICFVGDPTPDMIPLNDAARAISAKFESRWKHPIESLPGQYSQSLIDNFEKQLADASAKSAQPAQIEGLPELMGTIAAMMKQNQEILQALAFNKTPEGQVALARRA